MVGVRHPRLTQDTAARDKEERVKGRENRASMRAIARRGGAALLILLAWNGSCGRAFAADPPPRPVDDADLIQGFLPKEDLGVLAFLAAHPEYDGRGIVVAILDTGVDLGHEALQTTSTGAPKVLDVFDGTDDGHLPLPLAAQSGAPLRGLSGSPIRLPADLPAGTSIRLGVIVGRDYFPGGLRDRRERERSAAWRMALDVWEGSADAKEGPREEAIRDLFEGVLERGEEPGDLIDVAAIRAGDGWEVRIDTDADGDLAEEAPLLPYATRRDVAFLPDPIHLSVAVERIALDASSIFLFFDEGGHGTHVAGIVGGYYGPGDPLNGLAPGVQFLAAKVGNGRLGGATSHNSIMKAAQWAVDHGADAINLSFGGDSFFDDGREDTSLFLNELVEKTGVIICASAGNEGPALSTIGAPATAMRLFAWGAAISAKTQQTNYGAFDPPRDEMFHFSSRGPLLSGDPGVDFISPGAALSPLPTWGLVKGESWNGTSMASPQGAGLSALLLSACRQAGIPATPARLRRALREGARKLAGVSAIEQGDGIPQALRAFQALGNLAGSYPSTFVKGRISHDKDAREPVVDWTISVHNATGRGGGYYERDLRERHPYRVGFFVRPDFPSDSLQADRAGFLRIVRLTSDVPWLRAPLQEYLHSGGGTISVLVDPSKLEEGLNVGRVIARDVARPDAGIEFALVATIVKPREIDPRRPIMEGTWDLQRGDRRGVYVRVPAGATVARLRAREALADPANAYEVALSSPDLIRRPGERVRTRRFDLGSGEEGRVDLRVLGGSVLEIAVFSRWHDNRPGRLEWRLEFDGVEIAAEPPLRVDPGAPGTGFVLRAPTWDVDLRFEAALDREEEPLETAWRTVPDTLYSRSLNGLPAIVEEGTALIDADDGEDLEIDLGMSPEFEDFLDDALFRVHDNSGREVASGYLSDGDCAFAAPHRGVYRITFCIWARGTRSFDQSTVIRPVLLRRGERHSLKVHRTPVDGFRNGPDSLDAVRLLAGEGRRFFLRAEDLPEERLMRGTLRIRDRNDVALASAPIRADTRQPLPSLEERLSAGVDGVVARARILAGRLDTTPVERNNLLSSLDLCERLRSASPEPPRETKKKGKREPEEDEIAPDALWDLREAKASLLAGGADGEAFEQALAALKRSLPDAKAPDPRAQEDRRGKEASVERLLAQAAWMRGDLSKAREHLGRARSLDPDVRGWRRLDALLLGAEGKHEEAGKRAKGWLADHPDDVGIDEALVASLLSRGWWDLAAARLAAWPRLHPARAAELQRMWDRVAAAREGKADFASPIPLMTP